MNKVCPCAVLLAALLAGSAFADPGADSAKALACLRVVPPVSPNIPGSVYDGAVKAYRSAYPVVFGRAYDIELVNASQMPMMVGTPKYDADGCLVSYDGVQWEAPKFTDAVAVLRASLLAPGNALERAAVIDRAFWEALGRLSTPEEHLLWETKLVKEKLTFAAIKTVQLGKIAQNNLERKAMLERAYQSAYGRAAHASDLAYWGPRKEQYVSVRKAQIAYLYGAGMMAELPGTIVRALTFKLGRPPTQQEAKTSQIKALVGKNALFDDLVAMP